ncbi:MAG: hypothetical protein U5Q03_14930 [Bacteroidota bacterium]|nr:hypothetical protein [Bacteroidota bacterium]
MAAFDTAITPVSSAPANTSKATLFTASADSSVLVDVANIGTGEVAVRVGITPSGGSVHWKMFDYVIPVANSYVGLGPLVLQSGDAVTVRTDTADDAVFSLTGVETS